MSTIDQRAPQLDSSIGRRSVDEELRRRHDELEHRVRERTEALEAAAARDAFRVRLIDALRPLSDPMQVKREASRVLADHLGVNRALYAEIDAAAEHFEIEADVSVGTFSLAGVHRLEDYGAALIAELHAGRTVVVNDAAHDPRVNDAERATLHYAAIGAALVVPLARDSRLVAALAVHQTAARTWSAQDIAVLEAAAQRTFADVERATAEARRLEAEERYLALFNSIDQGFCTIDVAFDENDKPVDYQFVEVSPSFERQTGITNGAGRWMREIAADQDEHWFESYGRVALTGEPARFEDYSTPLDRWWSVYAFRIHDPQQRRIGVLFSDITERKQAEQALIEADRRKDEFLAMLAHELRNPLAPIRTGLELIRIAGDTPEAVARVRHMMGRQISHMVRLIDDLLDVSRISSGKIQLKRELTPLRKLIDGAIEANHAAISERGIALSLEMPDQPCLVDVDPTRFVQVLSNLLHNSTKFTEAGGTVKVRASLGAPDDTQVSRLTITVTDSGIGMSPEFLPQVFDLFTQGEGGSSQPGLGIGLALSRRLMEMHGGHIEARSAGLGHGSEFEVELPVCAQTQDESPSQKTTPRSLARKVVVIDDNEDAADTMGMLIESVGGTPRVAYDGKQGLREVLDHRPDVVLLDLGMQPLDGYETCRQIRTHLGSDVIVVALTGWGQEQDKQRALEAGFDAHLTKPIDVADLERLLAGTS